MDYETLMTFQGYAKFFFFINSIYIILLLCFSMYRRQKKKVKEILKSILKLVHDDSSVSVPLEERKTKKL